MLFCNYKLFIYICVYSESHTDIKAIHTIFSVFPTTFIWFRYNSVHTIFMQCCPGIASFIKVRAVKAILYFTMYLRFVHILYIFHPLWIKFSTGDVHKNVLRDHEFGENQYSKIHALFSIYEFCETLCRENHTSLIGISKITFTCVECDIYKVKNALVQSCSLSLSTSSAVLLINYQAC